MKKLLLFIGIVLIQIATIFGSISSNPVLYEDYTKGSGIIISNENLSLFHLLDGNQNYSLSYELSTITSNPKISNVATINSSISNPNTISEPVATLNNCVVNSHDGTQEFANNGTSCNFTFEISQSNATTIQYGANLSANHYEKSSNGIRITEQDLYYVDNTKVNDLDNQHFQRTYTLISDLGSFLNIQWSLNESNTVDTYNISSGFQDLNKTYEVDIIDEDTYFKNSDSTLAFGTAYNVWKKFNITNTLPVNISSMLLNISLQDYNQSGSIKKYNGTNYENYDSNISNSRLVTYVGSLTTGASELYNLSFDSNIIQRTISKATYLVEGSDGTYQRHYNFTPEVTYFSNFVGLGAKTITDSISTLTYLPNWNNKLNWGSDMTYNGSSKTHTSTDNSNFLSLSWTVADTNISSFFQVDYYIEETVRDSGGGGGGGGGGSTIINIIDDDLNKTACDITVSPKEIILSDSITFQELKITNNEEFVIDPEFTFIYLEGEKSLFNALRVSNNPETIESSKTERIGINLNTNVFTSNGTASANLKIVSTKCENVLVPIKINIKDTESVIDVFDGNYTDITESLINKRIFNKNDNSEPKSLIGKAIKFTDSVFGASIIFALIIAGLLVRWDNNPDSKWSQSTIIDSISRIIVWILIAGLVVLILNRFPNMYSFISILAGLVVWLLNKITSK